MIKLTAGLQLSCHLNTQISEHFYIQAIKRLFSGNYLTPLCDHLCNVIIIIIEVNTQSVTSVLFMFLCIYIYKVFIFIVTHTFQFLAKSKKKRNFFFIFLNCFLQFYRIFHGCILDRQRRTWFIFSCILHYMYHTLNSAGVPIQYLIDVHATGAVINYRSINQPANHSTNQSTSQPTNKLSN